MDILYKKVDTVVRSVEDVVSETDRVVEPYRRSAFKRFPTIFALLVAFGAATTFYGIERVIGTWEWLNSRPWLILFLGIGVLALTGRLYKKLGD